MNVDYCDFWLCKDEHCDELLVYKQDPYIKYGNPVYKNAFKVVNAEKLDIVKKERDLAIVTLKESMLQKKLEVEAKQAFIENLIYEMRNAINYLESLGELDHDEPEFHMLQGFKKCLEVS